MFRNTWLLTLSLALLTLGTTTAPAADGVPVPETSTFSSGAEAVLDQAEPAVADEAAIMKLLEPKLTAAERKQFVRKTTPGYTTPPSPAAPFKALPAGLFLRPATPSVMKLGPAVIGRITIGGQAPYQPYSMQGAGNYALLTPGGYGGAEFYPGAVPGWTAAPKQYMVRVYAQGLTPATARVWLNGVQRPLFQAGPGVWAHVFVSGYPFIRATVNPTGPGVVKFFGVSLRQMAP